MRSVIKDDQPSLSCGDWEQGEIPESSALSETDTTGFGD